MTSGDKQTWIVNTSLINSENVFHISISFVILRSEQYADRFDFYDINLADLVKENIRPEKIEFIPFWL